MTIGNFDGVHKGHQTLLAKVVAKARLLKVPAIAVTFEPHPFEFFARDNLTIPRLTRLREKFIYLAECGVDYVLIFPFNQRLANVSASEFVEEYLFKGLAPQALFIGDDFHFGYKRQGDIHLLKEKGNALGFSVEAISTVVIDGERISSTRVRKALQIDDLALAKRLLGRPYTLHGKVRRGDQRGRLLGFPTANIYLHRKLTPVKGVYTVLMHGIADQPLPGVANIGVRPTVDGVRCLLEVHLLDFEQEIYGRYVRVEFCEKLRDEMRYENLTLLTEQINKDATNARHYFQKQGVL